MRASVTQLEEFETARDDLRRIDYLPSPDDIADACATIKSSWTLSEKRRRFVGELMPDEPDSLWLPPVIDTSQFHATTGRGVDGAI